MYARCVRDVCAIKHKCIRGLLNWIAFTPKHQRINKKLNVHHGTFRSQRNYNIMEQRTTPAERRIALEYKRESLKYFDEQEKNAKGFFSLHFLFAFWWQGKVKLKKGNLDNLPPICPKIQVIQNQSQKSFILLFLAYFWQFSKEFVVKLHLTNTTQKIIKTYYNKTCFNTT